MSSLLLQPFHDKINLLYLKWAASETGDYFADLKCKLCDDEIVDNLIDHRLGGVHRAAVNHIAEQLINMFLSPGIVLRKEINGECCQGFCVFCNENLTNFSEHSAHLNSSSHREKVKAYEIKLESSKFGTVLRDCRISVNDYENNLVKKIIGNGIRVSEDEEYNCIPCNCEVIDEEQYRTHITGSTHLEWVIDQLCEAAVMIKLHKGITIKNGSISCMPCKAVLGIGLVGAEKISSHIPCEGAFEEDADSSDESSCSDSDAYTDVDASQQDAYCTNYRTWCECDDSSCDECELNLSWSDNEWEDIVDDDYD